MVRLGHNRLRFATQRSVDSLSWTTIGVRILALVNRRHAIIVDFGHIAEVGIDGRKDAYCRKVQLSTCSSTSKCGKA